MWRLARDVRIQHASHLTVGIFTPFTPPSVSPSSSFSPRYLEWLWLGHSFQSMFCGSGPELRSPAYAKFFFFFFFFFLFDYCRTHRQRRPVRTLASSLTPAECNTRPLPPSSSFCRYGPLHSFSFLALAPASYVFAQSLYFLGTQVKFFFFFFSFD